MFGNVLFPLLHFRPVLCKLLLSLCGTGAQRWQRLLSHFPFCPEEMDFRLLMDASFSVPLGFFVLFLLNSKWILSTLVQGRLTAPRCPALDTAQAHLPTFLIVFSWCICHHILSNSFTPSSETFKICIQELPWICSWIHNIATPAAGLKL